jgi:general secretion pathway protein L
MTMLLFMPLNAVEPTADNCTWQWCYREPSGQITTGQVASQDLSGLVENNPTWFESHMNIGLVLPSDEVLRIAVDVPGRTVNSMKLALPFALEEYLTSDIETVHIAHGRIRPGHRVSCAIIDEERLTNWLRHFAEENIALGWVLSEAQLLQGNASEVTILLDSPAPEQVLVVSDDQDAPVDRSMLATVLNSIETDAVRCIGGRLSDLELGQLASTPEIIEVETPSLQYLTERLASIAVTNSSGQGSFNLLQGNFAVRAEDSDLTVRWRRTWFAAGLWLCVAALGLLVQGYWFKHQADERHASNVATYQTLFPNDNPPTTTSQLKRRLANKLTPSADSDSNQSMVDLVLRTSSVFGAGAQVQALRFREKQMSLTVDVIIGGFDELDAIKARARQNGMTVDVSDATKENNAVRARLVGKYL